MVKQIYKLGVYKAIMFDWCTYWLLMYGRWYLLRELVRNAFNLRIEFYKEVVLVIKVY